MYSTLNLVAFNIGAFMIAMYSKGGFYILLPLSNEHAQNEAKWLVILSLLPIQ